MKDFLTLDGHENITLCKLCGARLRRVECSNYGWRMVHADPSVCIGKSWVADMNKLHWRIKNNTLNVHKVTDELWALSLKKHVGYQGNIKMVERIAKHPAFVRSCISAFDLASRRNGKELFRDRELWCKWVLSAMIHRLEHKNAASIVDLSNTTVLEKDIECAIEMAISSNMWLIFDDLKFSYLFKTGASIDTSLCYPVLMPEKMIK